MRDRSARLLAPIYLLIVMSCAGSVHAKSSLLLPYPPDIGDLPAATFDSSGHEIGRSDFSLTTREDGRMIMRVTMRIRGGAENHIRAELEPVEPGADGVRHLRLLTEQSQSFEADGSPMTLLQIDHTAGIASCTPPDGDPRKKVTFPLPEDDRVANVPMNLLFLPLARGEVDRVRFQLFVCRGGPRLWDFIALKGGPPVQSGDRMILEVRYGPDLGHMLSWVAAQVLPKLSFWFDTNHNGSYVGHRMPIYSKGPDILMIRDGVSPPALRGSE
jgi:hypothetical protein